MKILIVTDDKREPLGVFNDETRALNAQATLEKRNPGHRAVISSFDLATKGWLVAVDHGPVAVCSTRLLAVKAARKHPGASITCFTVDKECNA
jgi:hypothetical protein